MSERSETGDAKREAYKRAAEEIAAHKAEAKETNANIAIFLGASEDRVAKLLRWRRSGFEAETPYLMDEQATARAARSHARQVGRSAAKDAALDNERLEADLVPAHGAGRTAGGRQVRGVVEGWVEVEVDRAAAPVGVDVTAAGALHSDFLARARHARLRSSNIAATRKSAATTVRGAARSAQAAEVAKTAFHAAAVPTVMTTMLTHSQAVIPAYVTASVSESLIASVPASLLEHPRGDL